MRSASTKLKMAKRRPMAHLDRQARSKDTAARLNRSLRSLARCNRVLWQAQSEPELLQSICDVLVGTAGLRLVWVGYCEDDTEKTVRPMAKAGYGVDYLERLKFSWGNSKAGKGPVGDAIRTGRYCWIEDIGKDPRFSHGRTEAVARGYTSCVALPLIANVGPYGRLDLRGTLTIYGDAFDKSEVEQHADLATYLTCAVARLRSNLAQDVTHSVTAFRAREDRKRAEEELRERARLLDLTHDTIFVRDMSDRITFWNHGAEELYGWTSETAAGKISHQLTQTVFPARLEDINAELLRTDRWDGELVHTKRDGTQVVVASRWALQRDERGNPIAILETNNDITKRKRAEAEALEGERRYREVQFELAHANRVATMGQLTASIAHEVNQPIAAVLSNAQAALRWLSAQPPNLQRAQQTLDFIIKDATRAGDVIGRIRDLIKKVPPQKHDLQINDAILEIISLTRGELLSNLVSVQMQLAEGLPPIQGDRVQLQQVILNLVVNAVEAMTGVSEGSRELHIRTDKAESDDVLVAVRDSGPGLTSASSERVFEPFHTTKPGGLGMGLSICRSIIEAHGGRLWAAPNVPQGAAFHFTLPVHHSAW
jgi:two-component system, LuxR family, sensor kinase FixL